MKRYNRITSTLCVVMLALCLVLFAPEAHAENDPIVEDRYSLTVEFGSLAFYYDHGVWDPNVMNYVASSNDTTAAAGTTAGWPGWYGFDGTANMVLVQNTSREAMDITVSLTYSPMESVTGVQMTVKDGTADPGVGVVSWAGSANSYQVTLPQSKAAVALIQLQGEPRKDGNRYVSENQMEPIGMIYLTIENPTP